MKTTCFNFQKLCKFKFKIKLNIHKVLTLQGLTLFFPFNSKLGKSNSTRIK